jgi:hypothetical protein
VELGGARWLESDGGASELGRLDVGDGADSWSPVDKETRERRPARMARTKRESVFPMKTRPTRGLGGPAGAISAYGGGAASGLARPEAEWAAKSTG